MHPPTSQRSSARLAEERSASRTWTSRPRRSAPRARTERTADIIDDLTREQASDSWSRCRRRRRTCSATCGGQAKELIGSGEGRCRGVQELLEHEEDTRAPDDTEYLVPSDRRSRTHQELRLERRTSRRSTILYHDDDEHLRRRDLKDDPARPRCSSRRSCARGQDLSVDAKQQESPSSYQYNLLAAPSR